MTKGEHMNRSIAPQTQRPDTMVDSVKRELTSSFSTGDLRPDPWPAIRQAVHAYARDPSEENALAVEVSMRLLQQQRAMAHS